MNYDYPAVFRGKRAFRVAIVGQPDNHLTDWRGCNYRRMALPKHLRRDFDTAAEARAYQRELETGRLVQMVDYARRNGDGSWFDEKEML